MFHCGTDTLIDVITTGFHLHVLLIQVCQAAPAKLTDNLTSKDPLPTRFSDPYNDQHESLCRPNTVLLLATVRGGIAVRGLFLNTIGNANSAADGKNTYMTCSIKQQQKL